jgi:hypothetical protein
MIEERDRQFGLGEPAESPGPFNAPCAINKQIGDGSPLRRTLQGY